MKIEIDPKEALLIYRVFSEYRSVLNSGLKTIDKKGFVNIRKNEIISMPIKHAEKEYLEVNKLANFFERIARVL